MKEALFFREKVVLMTRNSVFLGKSKTVLIALFVSANLVLNFLATPMALADDSSNLCQSLASNQRTEAQKLRQEAIDARNNGDDEQAVSLDEEAAKADEDAAKLESAAGDCPINDPSEIGKVLGDDDNNDNNGNNTIRKNTVHKNTVHKNTIRQNNGNPTSRNNGN
jgi:hypothetical protein